jgi:hypothetical protein
MTASVTDSPSFASASDLSFCRMTAEISGGDSCLPSASTRTSPPGPLLTEYGIMVISSETSENLRPMNRLMEKMVLAGS